jgi:fluoroquinolone transport system permease protein
MGLFFMGAIVLFEKSERVLDSVAISPVKPVEYVLSKLCSITVISTAVGLLIGIFSNDIKDIRDISYVFNIIIGVFLGSCLFSAIGLIIASKITTLNKFIIATIPFELIINIPAMIYLFGFKNKWLLLHPGACMIEICTNGENALISILILLIWLFLFVLLAYTSVKKMLQSLGGVKL